MSYNSGYKRNLKIGSVLSVLIILATSVASFLAIQSLLKSQESVLHTNQVLLSFEQVISAVKDAETGQRGYLLTGNGSFLEPYQGAKERAWEAYDQVSSLTVDNKEQQDDMGKLSLLLRNRFSLLEASVEKKSKGIAMDTAKLSQGMEYMQQLRTLIVRMEQRENVLLRDRNSTFGFYSTYTPWVIIVASIAAIIVAIVFFVRLSADYNQRLRMESELKRKDEQLQKRMDIVSRFAGNVAKGDYSDRISDEELH